MYFHIRKSTLINFKFHDFYDTGEYQRPVERLIKELDSFGSNNLANVCNMTAFLSKLYNPVTYNFSILF